jgi:serine-type D-Ala-D-Ala carboxypeptidase/endopeptidase
MMTRLLMLALALSATLALARTQPEPAVPAATFDAAVRAKLAERIDIQHAGVGIVIGVITPEGRKVFARGPSSTTGGRDVDGSTLFEIASLTKVFTTLLLSDMVQRGEVALDDPIAKFLPAGMKLPERGGRSITLKDLATHTSGLPRLPTNFAPRDPSNPYADYTVEQLYQFLSTYELTRDIGAEYHYSNLGMGLLGQVLARRADTDYESLVVARIARPLGLDATRITLSPPLKARLASGHNEQLEPVPLWEDATLAGAGSLFSSVDDLLAFLAASFEDETPIAADTAAALAARRPTGYPGLDIGLGWHISHRHGEELVWHNGGTAGFASYMAYVPEARVGIVVLANSGHGVDDLALGLIDKLVRRQDAGR